MDESGKHRTGIEESAFYQYNDSNQNTTVDYTYDENGNRVFQLNYNLHTDEDWKDNSGNGNGNNKDNAGSGNNGNGNSSSGNNGNNGNGNGNSGNSGNGNGNFGNNGNSSTGNNGNPGNSGNGKGEGNTGNTGNGNSGNNGNGSDSSGNNGNDKGNSKSEGTDDAGYGNATNAEEYNSQNQSGILFPIAEEISRTETDLIAMIKTTGKEKNYELIEYISDVNTQYTQVLMELNENGAMDAAYTYGTSRLTEDRFTGESNFYLYDPAGNVAGITDQNGYLWQSYRYDAFGNATFGSPQYDNEYTFNGESYNPNIHSQYLRARYYDTVKGSFLTEDSYLGDIRNPLTLNRYSYCIGNPLFYSDPSGYWPTQSELNAIYKHVYGENGENRITDPNASATEIMQKRTEQEKEYNKLVRHLDAMEYLNEDNFNNKEEAERVKTVLEYNYSTEDAVDLNKFDERLGEVAYRKFGVKCGTQEINKRYWTFEQWLDLYNTPTVKEKGRLVSIPEDRPRERGTYWGIAWGA